MTVPEIKIAQSTIISGKCVSLPGYKQTRTQNAKHSYITASKSNIKHKLILRKLTTAMFLFTYRNKKKLFLD